MFEPILIEKSASVLLKPLPIAIDEFAQPVG
jgi:hypothetical protein